MQSDRLHALSQPPVRLCGYSLHWRTHLSRLRQGLAYMQRARMARWNARLHKTLESTFRTVLLRVFSNCVHVTQSIVQNSNVQINVDHAHPMLNLTFASQHGNCVYLILIPYHIKCLKMCMDNVGDNPCMERTYRGLANCMCMPILRVGEHVQANVTHCHGMKPSYVQPSHKCIWQEKCSLVCYYINWCLWGRDRLFGLYPNKDHFCNRASIQVQVRGLNDITVTDNR